jgi:hypothetical protein
MGMNYITIITEVNREVRRSAPDVRVTGARLRALSRRVGAQAESVGEVAAVAAVA